MGPAHKKVPNIYDRFPKQKKSCHKLDFLAYHNSFIQLSLLHTSFQYYTAVMSTVLDPRFPVRISYLFFSFHRLHFFKTSFYNTFRIIYEGLHIQKLSPKERLSFYIPQKRCLFKFVAQCLEHCCVWFHHIMHKSTRMRTTIHFC